MLRMKWPGLLLTLALLAACAPAAPARAPVVPGASKGRAAQAESTLPAAVAGFPEAPASCAVTRPPSPAFIPPAPNSARSPYPNEFWYGSQALWTRLETNGAWWALPHDNQGYSQKVFFWRKGYNYAAEPQPRLTVTGRRLDGDAPPLIASSATNGFEAHLQSFMLVGVEVPTLGCWEITGRYAGQALSFVVWVAP